ncbi:tetratricopeptide repeat protein [Natronospira bacteriovora]|uniref:Tetratricopeptide repeat protein n=1 Tax=Natronospira bacteriovora TaxID=3069753 RepID=A0ABU0W6L8_9GAMM|nr:tetratricopeptide repeat protein [Natronospira sp. AB-CW4]MDQ2069678.1 tetratricopeptide repeat protein [Natronospira sp. AB-CW4]
MLDRLLTMLEKGQDNAMLRFSLGQEYARRDRHEEAARHFAEAVRQQPDYSAAWKGYGKALANQGALVESAEVYRRGIAVAEEKGDKQAAREMQVFLKRIEKNLS